MSLNEFDVTCFERAIELAREAESLGNLPVGAVIALDGVIVAEGQSRIWQPLYDPTRHAEIEALRTLPDHLRERAPQMTLYSTLEPCLMCMGTILVHRIGRVLYGSADNYGGGMQSAGHLPQFFENQLAGTDWVGPVYADACDPLFERLWELIDERRADD